MIEAIAIEGLHQLFRQRLLRPLVFVVPPGDDRSDVQILGPHQQFDVLEPTMDVQFSAPPALPLHVDKALQDHRVRIVGSTPDLELPGAYAVLGTPFHLERVLAWPELQAQTAIEHEMVVPRYCPGRKDRFAALVFQVHPHRDGLLRVLVRYRDLDLAVGGQ